MPGIFDWSATPSSNTTVDSINIAEGCPAGNVNNALRSIMGLIRQSFSSTLANFFAGTSALAIANGGTGATDAAGARAALGAASSVDAVPSGAVFYFAATTAPAGYLVCNGSTISRTTYAALFAVIGTTFGAGDGATTFRLPDLRGEFIRGWDNSRGVDSGRSFGTFQADELKAHSHDVRALTGKTVDAGGSSPNTAVYNYHNEQTGTTGGTETRPRNIALLPCIKV